MHIALLLSVFVVASCGLAYELIAGALSSYLIGDSVTQFSTVIGTYLFAMGVGSYLSRFVIHNVAARFIQIELLVGLIGGYSAVALFWVYVFLTAPFKVVLYGLVMLTGTLVGLE
ncbi:MAG: polyamine aminopropyltransferase 1, partial [Pseudomonadota bacterium]